MSIILTGHFDLTSVLSFVVHNNCTHHKRKNLLYFRSQCSHCLGNLLFSLFQNSREFEIDPVVSVRDVLLEEWDQCWLSGTVKKMCQAFLSWL